jgi:hypothetical protein
VCILPTTFGIEIFATTGNILHSETCIGKFYVALVDVAGTRKMKKQLVTNEENLFAKLMFLHPLALYMVKMMT